MAESTRDAAAELIGEYIIFKMGLRGTNSPEHQSARRHAEELAKKLDEASLLHVPAEHGPGHHVMVTVDPGRNGGSVSFTRGMAPLYAAVGCLAAGDGLEQVREEYGLDESQAAVLVGLADLVTEQAETQLRPVYRERAQLVAHLASLYPSVIAFSDPMEPEWPVVYVDTPAGQCSWHLSLEDLDLFGHIEQVPADDPRAVWDGHSTEEKYGRLAELARAAGQPGDDVEPPPDGDVCRPERVVVDGHAETVVVRGGQPLGEEGRAALAEVVAAARRHIVAANPHLGVIQELLAAARLARWCIPDGVLHTRFGEHDGTEVKDRLQAAAQAAREALTPPKQDGENAR